MAKSKNVSTKTSKIKDPSTNSTEISHPAIGSDRGGQSEKILRRSRRLQGMPIPIFNPKFLATIQAMSSEITMSASTLPDGAILPSDNDSTLTKVTDSATILNHRPFKDAESLSTNPNISIKTVLNKSDVDVLSDRNETGNEDSKDSDVKQNNNKKDNRLSEKPLRSEQDHLDPTLVKSKKRKAAACSAEKTTKLALAPPREKKQKVKSSTPKRQRKAGNEKPKTAKERFLAASADDTRPLPWGEPEVWAETRPELCEALPWFRCWQGAGHTHGGYVFGVLLDEDQGKRAYMDEHVVITRAGGGIGKNESGEICQIKDHDSENGRIKAFIKNEEQNIPLHLIIGQNNIHCPSRIPHRYCITPDFHITDHWDEKSNDHVVVKFRLEKTDLNCKSWYAAEDSPEVHVLTDIKALRKECPECNVTRPQVFASGWMCLNGKCALFWTLDGCLAPEAQNYNLAFLKERWVYDGFLPPYAMKPELIQPNANHGQAFPATRQCWEGIVCKICGRCNLRQHWDAWRCRTEGCPFEHKLPMDVIPASSVMGDAGYGFQGHGVSQDKISEPSIICEIRKHGLYRECVYQLGDGLTITHLNSNNVINSAPGGPDDLFCQLQKDDVGLERLPMKQSVVEQTYSRHFSHNFGMPYNYVVGHDNSTSLADAPEGIKEAVRRMTWAAKRAVVDEDFVAFNEVLAIGYFETMKMNYHDDGEVSLGPTVASISLGCPAKMKWRLKMKYWCGFKDKDRKHYEPDQPILRGCRKPEERRKLNELAKTASAAELDAAAQVALAFGKGESKTPPVVLELDLRHGDYMVMHGASMQIYYEHMVTPTDKLRFGLTCRYVKPEMVPENMRSMGDLTLDPANAYDGDLELYKDHMEKYETGKVTKRRIASVAFQA
ncbi:MAG: hypothetical protein ALECFALPRED_003886 [Alectoria fallacina]|uniref:Alpha-ketoglutarate-dependent dioxygenase AlkB-like domain-containing protein n=1 Tax=Alectoria fallacina TaxID=1903189 RepID=A0A8H3I575_9LECA|nr:MAG: hypothetical protein ALECFALPRED_003886 [Alectoria fallacina]